MPLAHAPWIRIALGCTLALAIAGAQAEVIVLRGTLDASQVVAPVFQTDANGNPVLDANGNPIVIGSTPFKPNGEPVSTSTATGFARVEVDTVAATIDTYLTWNGLTGVADRSHLHDAPPGVSRLEPPNDRFFHEVIGDVYDATDTNFLRVSVVGGYVECGDVLGPGLFCAPASGSLHDTLYHINDRFIANDPTTFADMAAFVVAMKADGLFLDLHTAAYPGGEIRGQLIFAPVPEPTNALLLAAGLLALGAAGRRRQRG